MARPAKNAATLTSELTESAEPVVEKTADAAIQEEEKPAEKVTEKKKDVSNGMPFKVKDGVVSVVSVTRAGKTIFAVSGKAITFDADGKATVSVDDAMYLSKCSGFEFN